MTPPHECNLSKQERRIFDAIRACLSPDLLTPAERAKIGPCSHPVTGHCFVATHAAYHLIGIHRGLQPHVCNVAGGGTHWWLWNGETREYLDPTFEQAVQPFPYDMGRRNLLYTRKHNRTDELVRRVIEYLK